MSQPQNVHVTKFPKTQNVPTPKHPKPRNVPGLKASKPQNVPTPTRPSYKMSQLQNVQNLKTPQPIWEILCIFY
jgi:hypothetical protein